MLLLVGLSKESEIFYFSKFLKKKSLPYIILDQNEVGKTIHYNQHSLLKDNKSIPLSQFTGVFNRYASFDPNKKHSQSAYNYDYLLNYLLNNHFKRVVNKPMAGFHNYSKPTQLLYQNIHYLKYPKSTIYANCTIQTPNSTIYKSISYIKSIPQLTNSTLPQLPITCPTLFQEKIIGNDIRVHVICHIVIATMKVLTAHSNVYRIIKLPKNIEQECVLIAQYNQLTFATIDLIKTVEYYYFLEANAGCGYSQIEENLECQTTPISDALLIYFTKKLNV